MRTKQPSLLSLQNKGRSVWPLFRVLLTAFFFLSTASQAWAGNQFVRGDANGDGAVDISDGIATLQYLFSCGEDCPMVCDDAADFDDNGAIEITDAILTFGFLFQGAAAPVAPYPDAGEDSTEDGLGCGPEASIDQVSAGNGHTCANMEEGEVYCWGSNDDGRLGDDSGADQLLPSLVQLDGAADQVEAGWKHSCFLSGGTVWCAGKNSGTYTSDGGQLGDGTNEDRAVPVEVLGLTDVVQVDVGFEHTCALQADGTVSCWGGNYFGQLGDGHRRTDRNEPLQVAGLTDVTKIALGGHHSCALDQDGAVSCWGRGSYGAMGLPAGSHQLTPELVEDLPEVVDIDAGGHHTCAITTEGTAWCWGRNDKGQCGDREGNYGGSSFMFSPTEVPGLSDVESLATGGLHTCALTGDASAYCWGHNGYNQTGPESGESDEVKPILLGGLDVLQVSADWYHSCALTSTQGLWCWGRNGFGQLGDNTTDHRSTPVPVIFPGE